MRLRSARLAASSLALAALLESACRTAPGGGAAPAHDPRADCRKSFAACAPPASFSASTDVSDLDVRKLVQVASRLDVPDELAASAAARLRSLAKAGDEAVVLEMEAAIDDTESAFERCRCEGIRSELEKQGIREAVAGRLPPRQQRSPEYWAGLVFSRLAAAQDLARRSAGMLALGAGGQSETAARAREAERALCETVHAARSMLPRASFESMLDAVHRRRMLESGAGSAEAATRTLRELARSTSCEPKAPPPEEPKE